MNKITAIVISTMLLFCLTSCIYTEDDIKEAKDSAYNEGYQDGWDDGWNKGYSSAKDTYLRTNQIEQPTYGTSYEDGITSSSVFVTQTGSKYHAEWCRYLEGKSNLSYYDSASEAESAGYTPCSVCH